MPELPEVETIRGYLLHGTARHPSLLGMRIMNSEVLWPRSLATPDQGEFKRRIVGQTVAEIGRRGKFLILGLDADSLLVHLRMSGDLRVEAQSEPLLPHDRLLVGFESGWRLAFNDTRKFGRAWLVSDPETVTGNLGPEPLDDSFTDTRLYEMLHQRRRQLKPLLLDQSFLAGLGNIYTDEALFRARLHPLTVADQVTAAQAAVLWKSIRDVLEEGIQRQGASIDWVYRNGDFQNYFNVYQRTGEPCPTCGTAIERIEVGQRGTHFCPQCQAGPVNEC